MTDSRALADRVADRLGEVPTIPVAHGIGINVHAIILATLEILAEDGILTIEPVTEPEPAPAP